MPTTHTGWPRAARPSSTSLSTGRPSRAAAIERLIDHARSMDGLWIAAGDEIAAWVGTLDLPPPEV
jgi:hypothetical protein